MGEDTLSFLNEKDLFHSAPPQLSQGLISPRDKSQVALRTMFEGERPPLNISTLPGTPARVESLA